MLTGRKDNFQYWKPLVSTSFNFSNFPNCDLFEVLRVLVHSGQLEPFLQRFLVLW